MSRMRISLYRRYTPYFLVLSPFIQILLHSRSRIHVWLEYLAIVDASFSFSSEESDPGAPVSQSKPALRWEETSKFQSMQ